MGYTLDLSKANEEYAGLTGVGIFAYTYLLGGDAFLHSVGLSIAGALAILGITGVSKTA